jgi:hypothetical protein
MGPSPSRCWHEGRALGHSCGQKDRGKFAFRLESWRMFKGRFEIQVDLSLVLSFIGVVLALIALLK